MPHAADILANLGSVRRRIEAAAHRAHRSPSLVSLVAVSKTFPAEFVRAAARAGHLAFGENRVQEGSAKKDALPDLAIEWHLIGHLQSNKARKAVASFDWIQSVDSVELLGRIDAAARDAGRRIKILVQADLAGEVTKHGAGRAALNDLVAAAAEAAHVDLRGLMIVPPYPDNPEDSRPWFRQLRDIRDELVASGNPAEKLADLSMGMSHDFEVAIEEGATIVRVGTAIFGHRDYGAEA
jgi:pyridoxal phosphate enzyme (YggS family)